MQAVQSIESKFPGFTIKSYVLDNDKTLRSIFRGFVGCKAMGVELANDKGRRILMLTTDSPQRENPIPKVAVPVAEPAPPRTPAPPEEPQLPAPFVPLPTEPRTAWTQDASPLGGPLEELPLGLMDLLSNEDQELWKQLDMAVDFGIVVTSDEVMEATTEVITQGRVQRKTQRRKRTVKRAPAVLGQLLRPDDLHDGEREAIEALLTGERPKRKAAVQARDRFSHRSPPKRRCSAVRVVKETCPVCQESVAESLEVTYMECCLVSIHDKCLKGCWKDQSDYKCIHCQADLSTDIITAIMSAHRPHIANQRARYDLDTRDRRRVPAGSSKAKPSRPWRCKREHVMKNNRSSWATFSSFKRLLGHASKAHGTDYFSAVTRSADQYRVACLTCRQEIVWTGRPDVPLGAMKHLLENHDMGEVLGHKSL